MYTRRRTATMDSPQSMPAGKRRSPITAAPYDTPPEGRCVFMELPAEIMEQVFLQLDLRDLTRCFRINKAVNEYMTSSASINVYQETLACSLKLNPEATIARKDMPYQMPLTSAEMLSTIRERITRFANLKPKSVTEIPLTRDEGRLYEYLEGVLLRSVGGDDDDAPRYGREMVVYDLRAGDEWDDVEEKKSDISEDDVTTPESDSTPIIGSTSQVHHEGEVDSDEHEGDVDSDEHGGEAESDTDDIILGSDSEEHSSDDEFHDAETNSDDEPHLHAVHVEWDNAWDNSDTESESDASSDLQDAVLFSPSRPTRPTVVDNDDPSGMGISRTLTADFNIMEMAVDPGQDLLILISLRPRNGPNAGYTMYIHLLSLTDFDMHPEAAVPVLEWPLPLTRRVISLEFQICDDNLFIMNKARQGSRLVGWNWRKGKQIMTLDAPGHHTFQSFLLLSPSSFVIPSLQTTLDPESDATHGDLDNINDLIFSNHLMLYAFPDNGTIPDAPWTATHVATIDLPPFEFDILRGQEPPRFSARADPPPRQNLPLYPLHAPAPFAPEPASGIVIFEIHLPDWFNHGRLPHYGLFMLKSTLLRYMPAPTSPLLRETWSRPVPVIPFEKITPFTRMLGPDLQEPNWVCYVYQYRFVTIEERPVANGTKVRPFLVLYDFDPMRVRKERLDRIHRLPANVDRSSPEIDRLVEGDVDGIDLVLSEKKHEKGLRLENDLTMGSQLPYVRVSRRITAYDPNCKYTALIDSERILIFKDREGESERTMDVMQF